MGGSTYCALFVLICGAYCSHAEGFGSEVSIYRDHYGVPHIVGDTEAATFFGYGYAQAEDHLERMMLEYRDAQARRSEILGKRALEEDPVTLNQADYRWGGDYLQRLMRTWQTVADKQDQINPEVHALLDAFAGGVNKFIDEHRAELPSWIEHVSAIDVEALERSHYMCFYSAGDGLAKLKDTRGGFPDLGSNQWAVAPSKTANGQIMHVEHVHMPWGNRLQLYEAHLITPGKLNVAGMGWFGSPFFLSGFNNDVSWSITWNQPNISDIYEEALNPRDSLQYLYEGKWRNIFCEKAVFTIGEEGKPLTTVTRNLYYTHHGPIVRFDKVHHKAYSLKVPNFDGVNYSTGLYSLMKVKTIREFQDALAKQLILRWNFLCTDEANMYWVHNGVVARRDPGYNWQNPVPGWTKATEWKGYLPFSANPQLLNPASNFIQNSNNPPWVSTRDSGLNPLSRPPYYFEYPVTPHAGEAALNLRGERLFGVLTRPAAKFTFDQMVSLGFDTYILAADAAVPLLTKARSRHKADIDAVQASLVLERWDRRAEISSAAFTYFRYWAKVYGELYTEDCLSRFNSRQRYLIASDSTTEQDLAWMALAEGLRRIRKTFGTLEVPWGEINRVEREGSFPVAGTGSFDVLHPDEGSESAAGRIECDRGWGHLMVITESQPKQVWSLLPFGESEHPESPHYNDQARLHSEQHLKRFWFTREEIMANTESVWGEPSRITSANF